MCTCVYIHMWYVAWADQSAKCAHIHAICTVSMKLHTSFAIAHFVTVIDISHLDQSINIATYRNFDSLNILHNS